MCVSKMRGNYWQDKTDLERERRNRDAIMRNVAFEGQSGLWFPWRDWPRKKSVIFSSL